jgi:ATP-binding cassette subfamily C (CFTR/MRP) protein 1
MLPKFPLVPYFELLFNVPVTMLSVLINDVLAYNVTVLPEITLWSKRPQSESLSINKNIYLHTSCDVIKSWKKVDFQSMMRMPMSFLPSLIINLIQAGVSLDRINKFMSNSELDPKAVEHDLEEEEDVVRVEGGTFKWDEDEPEVLKEINIRIKKGSLTAIVGTVGSGMNSTC